MIYEKMARLRALYPDDIEQIEAEEQRVSALLRRKEYALQPETQELLSLCRADILMARRKLATERSLDEKARAELWAVIDAREWVLKMLAQDFDAQLEQIESELTAELARV